MNEPTSALSAIQPQPLPTSVIQELAAVGAAIGANCEPCLAFHHERARQLGLTNDQLAVAVTMAQRVKNAPAAKILDLAAQLLEVDVQTLTPKPRA